MCTNLEVPDGNNRFVSMVRGWTSLRRESSRRHWACKSAQDQITCSTASVWLHDVQQGMVIRSSRYKDCWVNAQYARNLRRNEQSALLNAIGVTGTEGLSFATLGSGCCDMLCLCIICRTSKKDMTNADSLWLRVTAAKVSALSLPASAVGTASSQNLLLDGKHRPQL